MTQIPHRIQRKRTRGWRLPPNTICVTRGTVWGNPFRVTRDFPRGAAVAAFELLCLEMQKDPDLFQAWIRPLIGKNLACFCPLDKVCHADVLLRLAKEMSEKVAA